MKDPCRKAAAAAALVLAITSGIPAAPGAALTAAYAQQPQQAALQSGQPQKERQVGEALTVTPVYFEDPENAVRYFCGRLSQADWDGMMNCTAAVDYAENLDFVTAVTELGVYSVNTYSPSYPEFGYLNVMHGYYQDLGEQARELMNRICRQERTGLSTVSFASAEEAGAFCGKWKPEALGALAIQKVSRHETSRREGRQDFTVRLQSGEYVYWVDFTCGKYEDGWLIERIWAQDVNFASQFPKTDAGTVSMRSVKPDKTGEPYSLISLENFYPTAEEAVRRYFAHLTALDFKGALSDMACSQVVGRGSPNGRIMDAGMFNIKTFLNPDYPEFIPLNHGVQAGYNYRDTKYFLYSMFLEGYGKARTVKSKAEAEAVCQAVAPEKIRRMELTSIKERTHEGAVAPEWAEFTENAGRYYGCSNVKELEFTVETDTGRWKSMATLVNYDRGWQIQTVAPAEKIE